MILTFIGKIYEYCRIVYDMYFVEQKIEEYVANKKEETNEKMENIDG